MRNFSQGARHGASIKQGLAQARHTLKRRSSIENCKSLASGRVLQIHASGHATFYLHLSQSLYVAPLAHTTTFNARQSSDAHYGIPSSMPISDCPPGLASYVKRTSQS